MKIPSKRHSFVRDNADISITSQTRPAFRWKAPGFLASQQCGHSTFQRARETLLCPNDVSLLCHHNKHLFALRPGSWHRAPKTLGIA